MLITLISLNNNDEKCKQSEYRFDLTTLARPRSRMTIREEGLIVKDQVLLRYFKRKEVSIRDCKNIKR